MVSVVSTRNNRSNELFNESCHFPPKKKESVLPRGTTSTHACFFICTRSHFYLCVPLQPIVNSLSSQADAVHSPPLPFHLFPETYITITLLPHIFFFSYRYMTALSFTSFDISPILNASQIGRIGGGMNKAVQETGY